MATPKTVNYTIKGADDVARAGIVTATLSRACTIPGTSEVVTSVINSTTTTGSGSLTLYANDDLTPTGTYYTVKLMANDGGFETLTIQVPQTAGPFEVSNLTTSTPTASPSPNHVSTLTVDGTSTLTGAVTASSTLDVKGAATLESTVGVTGLATLSGGVTVSGAVTLPAASIADSALSTNVALINAQQTATGRKTFSLAIPATANYGMLSVGPGAWDGTSGSRFIGSANGTLLAGNSDSAFTGNFIDFQRGNNGSTNRFYVAYDGTVNVGNNIQPITDAFDDIGTGSLRFRDIHLSRAVRAPLLDTDTAVTLTLGGIASGITMSSPTSFMGGASFDSSGRLTLPSVGAVLTNTGNQPWYIKGNGVSAAIIFQLQNVQGVPTSGELAQWQTGGQFLNATTGFNAAQQRFNIINAPNVSANVAGITVPNATTFAIAGPPVATSTYGFTPTLTNPKAFWVQAGLSQLDGNALIGAAASSVGFYGAGAVAKQTVSGAKGGNAALASLMSALSALGLVTDSTSA